MARLEKWRAGMTLVETKDGDILPAMVFAGAVSGHDRLEDGDSITTSPVKAMDEENVPPKWVQTMNTRYELGEPYVDPKAN